MNSNVDRLYRMAGSPSRMIIGLMSGTSVDGLDVALCKCTGSGTETEIEVVAFETVPYNEDYRQEIKSVFSNRTADLQKVCLLNGWIAAQHAQIVNDCLAKWKIDRTRVDLLASHGQTIYHAPKYLHALDKFTHATLQIGDGDHLAVSTGIITVSDFRQKHIAAGGEGAPLAVYGDYFIFRKKGENRIMLNIGGIANFTCLPGGSSGRILSTDTGPGNTLMDAYVQQHFKSLYFDEEASVAARGDINHALLKRLKADDFFNQALPKTTGPELFNLPYIENAKIAAGIGSIPHEDMMATLNRFSADTIAEAILSCAAAMDDTTVYTSGGGMHNPLLMKNIQEQLPGFSFKTTDSLSINPDAKEAVLFAILANETVAGQNVETGIDRSGIPFVSMGKISFPD